MPKLLYSTGGRYKELDLQLTVSDNGGAVVLQSGSPTIQTGAFYVSGSSLIGSSSLAATALTATNNDSTTTVSGANSGTGSVFAASAASGLAFSGVSSGPTAATFISSYTAGATTALIASVSSSNSNTNSVAGSFTNNGAGGSAIKANSNGNSATAVFANADTGNDAGAQGLTVSTTSTNSGASAAVFTNSGSGVGITATGSVKGVSTSASAGGSTLTYGVYAQASASINGRGVYGLGGGYGVYGETGGSTGYGVYGYHNSSGAGYGVYGLSASDTGTGVAGVVQGGSSANKGVYGVSGSSAGYGGYFENTSAGYGLYVASKSSSVPAILVKSDQSTSRFPIISLNNVNDVEKIRLSNNGTASLDVSPNLMVNGNFVVWQRGTSITPPIGNTYTADRWTLQFDGTQAFTVTQQTFTVGGSAGDPDTNEYTDSRFFVRVTQTTAGSGATQTLFRQNIEDVRTLTNKTATLTYWARTNTGTRTINTSIRQNFGTGGSPSSTITMSNVAATIGTSWTKVVQTIAVPSITGKTIGTNGDSFLAVIFSLPLSMTATSWIDFAFVQLELGSVSTPFRFEPFATTLRQCMRYYQKSFAYGVTAAQNAGGTGPYLGTGNLTTGAVSLSPRVTFIVPMRSAPTVTLYNASAANAQVRNLNTGTDASASTAASVAADSFQINCTVPASAAIGHQYSVHWDAYDPTI